MAETLFTDILTRLRPGYKNGGRLPANFSLKPGAQGDYNSPGRIAQREKLRQKSFKKLAPILDKAFKENKLGTLKTNVTSLGNPTGGVLRNYDATQLGKVAKSSPTYDSKFAKDYIKRLNKESKRKYTLADINKAYKAKEASRLKAKQKQPRRLQTFAAKTQTQADILNLVTKNKNITKISQIAKALRLPEEVIIKEADRIYDKVYTTKMQLGKGQPITRNYLPISRNFSSAQNEKILNKLLGKLENVDGFQKQFQRNARKLVSEAYGPSGTNPSKTKFKQATKKLNEFYEFKAKVKKKYPKVVLDLDHPLSYNAIKKAGGKGEKFLYITPVDKSFNRGTKQRFDMRYDRFNQEIKDGINVKENIKGRRELTKLAKDLKIPVGKATATTVKGFGTKPLLKSDLIAEAVEQTRLQNQIVDNIKNLRKSKQLEDRLEKAGMKNYKLNLKPIGRKVLSGIGTLAKGFGRVVKPVGYALGANAVLQAKAQADEMDIQLKPQDYFMALEMGDAQAALDMYKMRNDPKFYQQQMVNLPQIQSEGFEMMEEEDFTSYFNGGIVAVKGVK